MTAWAQLGLALALNVGLLVALELVEHRPARHWRRSRRVDLATADVVKLFPQLPPVRGERVLVDDAPCHVTRCRVKWNWRRWRIEALHVRPAPAPRHR